MEGSQLHSQTGSRAWTLSWPKGPLEGERIVDSSQLRYLNPPCLHIVEKRCEKSSAILPSQVNEVCCGKRAYEKRGAAGLQCGSCNVDQSDIAHHKWILPRSLQLVDGDHPLAPQCVTRRQRPAVGVMFDSLTLGLSAFAEEHIH